MNRYGRVVTPEDTYAIGDYVRRWAHFRTPVNPNFVFCRVTDPARQVSLSTVAGSVVQDRDGSFYWHMIAGRVGQWRLCWSCANKAVQQEDYFVVIETPPDVSSKGMPILSDGDLTLVPLAPIYLELLRNWRNRDDVRCWFYDSAVISPEAQQAWYERYANDLSDLMWVALWQGKPVGTGALTHLDYANREGEWARLIIGEDWARGKGLAGRIAILVREYGLDVLKLERICGSLYSHNRNTMHIDIKAGYMPYREENGITYLELLRKDWRPD